MSLLPLIDICNYKLSFLFFASRLSANLIKRMKIPSIKNLVESCEIILEEYVDNTNLSSFIKNSPILVGSAS